MCSFLIMEQCFGPLAVELFQGKHCDSSTYLAKRARAQSGACAEVHFPDYGTVLWSPGSRNGSRKAGKHCDYSTYFTKRARAQFGAGQSCSFLFIEQCFGPVAVKIIPGNTAISTPILPRERAQSDACAEVQFPVYGTVLWSPVSRNISRKALRFQHLSCQECESSVWRMRRSTVSCLWNRFLVP
jgi:hypothetical protein